MKKVISLLLSVVIAFSVITPAIPGLDFAKIEIITVSSGRAIPEKKILVIAIIFPTVVFEITAIHPSAKKAQK